MTFTISKTATIDLGAKAKRRRDNFARTAHIQQVQPPARNDLVPDLKIIKRSLSSLVVPALNVRKHDPVQVQRVVSSVRAFGVVEPLLIRGDEIVAGVARYHAAQELGLSEVPCIPLDHLNAQELRHLRITLNRLAEQGQWSLPDLKQAFEDLAASPLSLEVTGFSIPEIDGILLGDSPAEISELEHLPAINPVATTRLGDIWLLGPHRLICGDARQPDTLHALMAGGQARLVMAEP